MNISEVSIRRGITFFMIYILIVGAGLFGLSQLKIDLYPDMDLPFVAIFTTYEGVGPEDIENVLTRPLEEAVISVEGVEQVSSTSRTGISVIFVEFTWGTDINVGENDIRKSIDMVRDYLPTDASEPITFAFNPSMQPILIFNVASDELGEVELKKVLTEQAQPRLERLEGVASVSISGGTEREIQILIDPYRLAANKLSMDQIKSAVGMANLDIPGGLLEEGRNEFSVITETRFSNVEDIRNVTVGYSPTGKPIYLKNVAEVVDGYKEMTQIVRNNRENGIVIVASKQSDANTVNTCNNIINYLPVLEEQIGNNVSFNVIFNQAEFIEQSVQNLSSTAILAFILSALVLFFFLRHIVSSLIVAVSIPISILLTFFIMSQLEITLNIISMAGLALAIGLLIDNSIVVLENIFRRNHELNEPIKKAAEIGTKEISMAITASTLTTISVFVPVLFLPGISGVLFKDMALTIVVSLLTSLFVALTLIPLLSSRFLSLKQQEHHFKLTRWFDTSIQNFLEKLTDIYQRSLKWILGHKKLFVLSVIGIGVISVILSGNIGGEFIPRTDEDMIAFDVTAEVGISLPEMNRIMMKVEEIITEEVPEMTNLYVNFGTGEGFAALFGGANNSASVFISLLSKDERERSQFDIEDDLREKLSKVPGIELAFQRGGPMMGAEGDLSVKIFGQDLNEIKQLSADIRKIMEDMPGLVDINYSYTEPKPEYRVFIDRERVSALGLSVPQIANTINTAIKGSIVSLYRERGEEYNVTVRFDRDYRQNKEDILQILVPTATGEQVPLSNLVTVGTYDGPTEISREDQSRFVSVNASTSGRDLQSIRVDLERQLKMVPFPPDVRYEIGGTAEEQQESFMYLGIAILVSIALVYMVMASQFESLLDPFIILFTVPLAFMGVIWALLITGTNIGVTVLIGGMLLVGIVVNNGIVLIDYINQILNGSDMKLYEAIVIGAKTRLRPVLMTAMTTILSMMPLALELGSGAEIWTPMARAVIGGLLVSTLLTLYFVPVLFSFFQKHKFADRM
ncbi:MAG: efflux RND transporter permease subunit [Fidelibacterota bacterium]